MAAIGHANGPPPRPGRRGPTQRGAFLAALTACALSALVAGPRPALASDQAPRKLRHLLRYVAADYRYAVQAGQITSRAEHDEQLLLLADAQSLASRLPRESAAVASSVAAARALVGEKAPERDVVAAVRAAEALVVGAYRLEDAPRAAPDPVRGLNVFNEHCASCHGPSGHADTARARSLSPPPPDLHDPSVGDGMSPFRAASAIEQGVDGTSMIPFTFLSEDDRWNVAFVVASLRHAERPRSARAPTISLPELATSTDGELLDHLFAAGASQGDLAPMLSALRHLPRTDTTPLEQARIAWDEARRTWTWRDVPLARRALLRGIHEGFEPARGGLVFLAPDAVSDVEQRAVLALSALSSPPDAAANQAFPEAIAELLVDTTRADLLAARVAVGGGPRATFTRALATAWAFLVECGAPLLTAAAAFSAAPRSAPSGRRGSSPRLRTISTIPGALVAIAALGVTLWITSATLPSAVSGAWRLLVTSFLALAAAPLALLACSPRTASPSRPAPLSLTARLVLTAAAAVLAGRSIHTAQLAGLLPAHALFHEPVLFPLAGPTWEAISAQAAFLVAGLLLLARHRRSRRNA